MKTSWSDTEELFYERLIAGYLDIAEAVERDWLRDKVQAKFKSPACQFVLIIGEPGAGKSSLMCALARQNPDWLRYFIRSDSTLPLSGGDAASLFFRIGHQFAHRRPDLFDPKLLKIEVEQQIESAGPDARIVGVKIDDLQVSPFYRTAIRVQQHVAGLSGGLTGVELSRATLEPRLLELGTISHLALLDPAKALARKSTGENVVVMIDALDEVLGTAGGATILDWLETAPALPPNLRFVLSSRPSERLNTLLGLRAEAVQVITIDGKSAEVSQDVRAFATRLFAEDAFAAQIEDKDLDIERAVTALQSASKGNFAYLVTYARAIRVALEAGDVEEVSELLSFASMPSGLFDLYADFARRMRRQIEAMGQLEIAEPRGPEDELSPAWEGVGARMLAVLSVAFGPLTPNQLVALGGIRAFESSVRSVLRVLQPFLEKVEGGWSLFHPSLAEFLTCDAQNKAPDVAVNAKEWHRRIIRHYRGYGSWDEVDWQQVDTYGLMHVAAHIAASDDDPAAGIVLVTAGLRAASQARFGNDLAFVRMLNTLRDRLRSDGTTAQALVDGLFMQIANYGLRQCASDLAPAVFGLMARMGEVEDALARSDVLEPGLRKFRSVEAIRECTPPELRDKLGPLDGVELLVGAAAEVPVTSGPIVGALGYELGMCLKDAAVAMVPFDFDRAMALGEKADDHERVVKAVDAVRAAAAATADPAEAKALIEQMSTRVLESAVLAAERASSGGDRDALIALAVDNLDEEGQTPPYREAARLLVLLDDAGQASAQGQHLKEILAAAARQKLPDDTSWGEINAAVAAAETLRGFDDDLAHRLMARSTLTDEEADTLATSALVRAAGVWIDWGKEAEARRCLEQALTIYRDLGWYGPAGDIAEAAGVAARIDPAWGEALADEAMALIKEAALSPEPDDRGRLNSRLSSVVAAFRENDIERALTAARWSTGDWVHGGPWDSEGGQGGIALIALDIADTDPKRASALLEECLAHARVTVQLGRYHATQTSSHLYHPSHDVETPSSGTMQAAMVSSYIHNFISYWQSGRDWRFFQSPADVLRSLEAPFPDTSSWARAFAAGLAALATTNPARAFEQATWIADPCERLVALAAICAAAKANDTADPLMNSALSATKASMTRYEAQVTPEAMERAPMLAYLNPAFRAGLEAALALQPDNTVRDFLPERDSATWYLHLALEATAVFDELLTHAALPGDTAELAQSINNVAEAFSKQDPVVGGLIDFAGTVALARRDGTAADERQTRLPSSTLKLRAQIARLLIEPPGKTGYAQACLELLDGADEEVSVLDRACLAAAALDVVTSANESGDALVNWGLAQLEGAPSLLAAHGLTALAPYADDAQGRLLLLRALREALEIGNQYLRADAMAGMLPGMIALNDTRLITETMEWLLDESWYALMDGFRRAMPCIVQTLSEDGIERMDEALRRAQSLLAPEGEGSQPDAHFDGVLLPQERAQLAAARAEALEVIECYLETFLTDADLGPGLKWVQDARLGTPDPDDQSFHALRGRHTGLSVWLAEPDQTIWRIVDIRMLFDNPEAAATYHQERLLANSEGHPPVDGTRPVGQECHVFGGTQPLPVPGLEMTAFFYVFRVGCIVSKLFVAQGTDTTVPLTPDKVAGIADVIVRRIQDAGFDG